MSDVSYVLSERADVDLDDIKEGLYSFPKDNHVIFHRIFNDHIRIIRVLYGSRDLPNSFLINII